jgi:hypothetical protein
VIGLWLLGRGDRVVEERGFEELMERRGEFEGWLWVVIGNVEFLLKASVQFDSPTTTSTPSRRTG